MSSAGFSTNSTMRSPSRTATPKRLDVLYPGHTIRIAKIGQRIHVEQRVGVDDDTFAGEVVLRGPNRVCGPHRRFLHSEMSLHAVAITNLRKLALDIIPEIRRQNEDPFGHRSGHHLVEHIHDPLDHALPAYVQQRLRSDMRVGPDAGTAACHRDDQLHIWAFMLVELKERPDVRTPFRK